MHVKDLMATEVVSVSPRATIAEAIQLLLARKVSGLPVVDEAGDLVGVLSEGDLLRRIEFETQDLPRVGCLVCSGPEERRKPIG